MKMSAPRGAPAPAAARRTPPMAPWAATPVAAATAAPAAAPSRPSLGGCARPRGAVADAAASATARPRSSVSGRARGGVAARSVGGSIKSAEEMMEEVVERVRRPTSEECPFCADAPVKENNSKCVGVCRNPQNVPGPLVFPHEMQTPEDAVRLQLNAMRENNVPRMNHGVQTLYEYAVDAGSMERSRYFGFSSDMYHFDHFMGKALWNFSDFIDSHDCKIHPAEKMECGRTRVRADVTNNVGETVEWTFVMVLRTFSKYKGCWMTHRLVRSDSPNIAFI